MTEITKAIFLSYASQDATVARDICGVLRSAGLEVWFDQSELRGGDAWDVSIRKKIKECALFVPMISANTNARSEGYFRLEWKLAVDRSHLMADDTPFLLPLVIDDTPEPTARVPERFRERQWSRLPAGEKPAEFVERVIRLLSKGADAASPAVGDRPAAAQLDPLKKNPGQISGAKLRGAQTETRDLSIIVLPFANRTGDPQQDYIADGITESLTMALARIRDAFIVNSNTAFAFKSRQITAQQVGKELGVRFVLQGGVQRGGNKFRISAQLADTKSNQQLWSESFDGDASDLLSLQDWVTARIGNSVGREMVIVAASESALRKCEPAVTDLLLRARALSAKTTSLKNVQEMECLLRQVLSLEPDHSSAMATLAKTLATLASSFAPYPDEVAREAQFEESRILALRAQQFDPEQPDIYVALGVYAMRHGDLEGARRAAERRLVLEPSNAGAYGNLAGVMIMKVEPLKAIELIKKGLQVDPRFHSDRMALNMGGAYFMLGDYSMAVALFQDALVENPNFAKAYGFLAMAHALLGNGPQSLAAKEEFLKLAPDSRLTDWLGLEAFAADACPAQYMAFLEEKLIPAWHKAELPE